MRIVLQRVSQAIVTVDGITIGKINKGHCLLLGVEHDDQEMDADWLLNKVIQARVFPDEADKMNKSLLDVGGSLLVISQFSLHAQVKKGNRPSFIKAAQPGQAEKLYNYFLDEARKILPDSVQQGQFGANMQLSLTNDGPLTIWYDSKNKV
jgi:D-tyrosyl-tRNA(Tyr) deacylase